MGTTAVLAATVLLAPQAAWAGQPLPDNTVVGMVQEDAPAPTDYDVTQSGRYWSVAAARGAQGSTANVTLRNGSTHVGSAESRPANTAWLAADFNTGRLPLGPYTQTVRAVSHPAFWSHWVQFVHGNAMMQVNQPGQRVGSPGRDDGEWLVDVRDVHLKAGEPVAFEVVAPAGGSPGTGAYLVSSAPGDVATYTRTATTAAASVTLGAGQTTGTFAYTAPATGWYGLALVNNLARRDWTVKAWTTTPVRAPCPPSCLDIPRIG